LDVEDLGMLTFVSAPYEERIVKEGTNKVRKLRRESLNQIAVTDGPNQIDAEEVHELLGLVVIVGNKDRVEPSTPKCVRQADRATERL